MDSKYVALLLLIGLAQQGLATNKQDDSFSEYVNYADTALQAFGYTGLKGVSYCKTLLFDAVSEFGKSIELLVGFIPEAKEAWSHYRECDTVAAPNAAIVCREATKLEYYDNVKMRFGNIGNSLKAASLNLIKLPTCMFVSKF